MEIEQLEALAFSEDRAAAVAALLPGTEEHFYWQGILLQHAGRLDEVEPLLERWRARRGASDDLLARLERRQLLLRAGVDLVAVAERLRVELGARLDDEAESVAAARSLPSALSQDLYEPQALLREALAAGSGLDAVAPRGLATLVPRFGALTPTQRTQLLSRLESPTGPHFDILLAVELREHGVLAFERYAVTSALSLEQLLSLAERVPELREVSAWANQVLLRHAPPSLATEELDPAAREARLTSLRRFTDSLSPAFHELQSLVLYHLLVVTQRLDRYDQSLLVAYLRHSRSGSFVRPEVAPSSAQSPAARPILAALSSLGLSPPRDEETLLRRYLSRLLEAGECMEAAALLRSEVLEELRASVRLCRNEGEREQHAAVLGPARFAALRDRVELAFTPRNPLAYGAADPVVLELECKNVPHLLLKVFRLNTLAYFLSRGAEPDASVDLDGMRASEERTLETPQDPFTRKRLRVELDLAPGTYVVELLGNGVSSRALVRKGSVRVSSRVCAAGFALRVFGEDGAPPTEARVWMGGREYSAEPNGEVLLPFANQSSSVAALVAEGGVAQVFQLSLPREEYSLELGLELSREGVVAGRRARALLRPTLRVGSTPLPLSLLEGATAELELALHDGSKAVETRPLKLESEREVLLEVPVPPAVASLTLTLRGWVRALGTGQPLEVRASAVETVNGIHREARIGALFLSRDGDSYAVLLLGRNGEPLAAAPLTIQLETEVSYRRVTATLQTDARGRVSLGSLEGVTALLAEAGAGVRRRWELRTTLRTPRKLQLLSGEPFELPAPAWLRAGALHQQASLLELRGDAVLRDCSASLSLVGGALRVAALSAGTYRLECEGYSEALELLVLDEALPRWESWVHAREGLRATSPRLPLLRSAVVEGDALVLRVTSAERRTRVHLVATRFEGEGLFEGLEREVEEPFASDAQPRRTHYLSERSLGDEHRYVLERRRARRRPGSLLEKPSLLLNPWALRTTTTTSREAAAGESYDAEPRLEVPAFQRASALHARANVALEPGEPCVDFLPRSAVVLANLAVPEDGELRVPLASLEGAWQVRIALVDPRLTSHATLSLPSRDEGLREQRLRHPLPPEGHFVERRSLEGHPAGATLTVDDVRSGRLELVDTVARALRLLRSLGDASLQEFEFLGAWHTLDDAARRAKYDAFACHELHLFLHQRDRPFFERVVRPYLAHKRHKTFLDRWLLEEDLEAYREPSAWVRLNALERVLLARRIPSLAPAVERFLGDAVSLSGSRASADGRLLSSLLSASTMGGDALDELLAEEALEPPAEKSMDRPSPPPRRASARESRKPSAKSATLVRDEDEQDSADDFGASEGGPPEEPSELAARRRSVPLYRGADRTRELAESDWWHVRVADAGPALLPPNRFWLDLARAGEGPFLSPHLGDCAGSLAASLCALALLDLPFEAATHEVLAEETRLTVQLRSHALAARTRVCEAEMPSASTPLVVGQSYLREDDRFEPTADGQTQERYVQGPLYAGVLYRCLVTLTNPSGVRRRVEVLTQVPEGSVPVAGSTTQHTWPLELEPYATQRLEYVFYFPQAGRYGHFPAHVSSEGALRTWAPPQTLEVRAESGTFEGDSWRQCSQHGSLEEVLSLLERSNLGRLELERVAWRMRDRESFQRITAHLASRGHLDARLWAYALLHGDRARAAQWIQLHEAWLRGAGPVLEGGLAPTEPYALGWLEHLEYAPLLNARAHRLGARREVLNASLEGTWRAFLEAVAHRASPSAEDRLAAAHYLFTMDRQEEALEHLAHRDAALAAPSLQRDYLLAYAACCTGDLARARSLVAPWLELPVERWRARFAAVQLMLEEAESKALTLPTAASTADAKGSGAEVGTALLLELDGAELVLTHRGLTACELRFYEMDLELLFSRQPFVQSDAERFSWIEPGRRLQVALSAAGVSRVPLPEELRGANLVLEAVSSGLRSAKARYAHDLSVELVPTRGLLRVRRASTGEALPAVYVKAFARQQDGTVVFFKDGYSDLCGRFDYATLSTDGLARVQRFALLLVAEGAGSVVLEAPPPQR